MAFRHALLFRLVSLEDECGGRRDRQCGGLFEDEFDPALAARDGQAVALLRTAFDGARS